LPKEKKSKGPLRTNPSPHGESTFFDILIAIKLIQQLSINLIIFLANIFSLFQTSFEPKTPFQTKDAQAENSDCNRLFHRKKSFVFTGVDE